MGSLMVLKVECLFSTIQNCESSLYTSYSLKEKENSQSPWHSFSRRGDGMDQPHSQGSTRLSVPGGN